VCGILGHFSTSAAPPDVQLWQRLVHLIAHRGPDDSTFWHDRRFAFGHRRLSIIELSSAGRQPMATDDGELVVTFNGEIYNYIELREELSARGHRFKSRSDTEVLLHGYRQWGTELPAKLRGMFAFALADRRQQQLFLARDRFGEKPLFFRRTATGVAFASEVKVLAAVPGPPCELNEHALCGYLGLNYVPGDETMLKGVLRIRPGTWALWKADGELRSGTYWAPPDPDQPDLVVSESEALDTLEELLDQSARMALRSDVPVGVLLSGGIDSSLVARSAARSGQLTAAYCLTFGEKSYSEWPKADRTARQLGVPLVEVRLDAAAAVSDFEKLVDHADDPLADSSALAVWTLTRQVARSHKVVLSGDGGDELFAGYLTYQATLLHDVLARRVPSAGRRLLARAATHLPTSERKVSTSFKLRRFLRAAHLPAGVAHFTWNGTWLPEEAASLVAAPLRTQAADALAQLTQTYRLPATHVSLRQLQVADVSEYLPNDILTKSDRMSMAHGLEVRSPLLDPDLAEFALRLPASMKVRGQGKTKWVLRELARQTYGVEVAGERKQGFSIPVHAWLRRAARPLIDELLSPGSLAPLPMLDASAIAGVVRDHMSGRRSYGFELWGLAVLVAWHRRFIQRRIEMPVTTDAPLTLEFEDVRI
jgi:asparagine synthase (glutamine-hydrolysing)